MQYLFLSLLYEVVIRYLFGFKILQWPIVKMWAWRFLRFLCFKKILIFNSVVFLCRQSFAVFYFSKTPTLLLPTLIIVLWESCPRLQSVFLIISHNVPASVSVSWQPCTQFCSFTASTAPTWLQHSFCYWLLTFRKCQSPATKLCPALCLSYTLL